MDLSVSDENILGHITEFKEIHDEYTTIQNEIKNFRKKYEKRIKELKGDMEKKETVIMEYMKINNHPGLNYKGTLITMLKFQQGNRISNKKKQEQMNSILSKYQITSSNPLYAELKDMFVSGTEKEKLKFKTK
tara:strand:- start:650 stop:1048 length:399 start_codon:yes stop_codon:yes gene_type:complete